MESTNKPFLPGLSQMSSESGSDWLSYFVNGLRELILNEAAASRKSVEDVWSWPLVRRLEAGYALNKVRPIAMVDNGQIELQVHNNQSRFREGDALFLGRANPRQRRGLPVTLEEERDDGLLVSLRDSKDTSFEDELQLVLDERVEWSLDVDFEDLSHFYLSALEDATASNIGRDRVLPLLCGLSKPRTDFDRYDFARQKVEGLGLDEAQAEAIAQAYASELAWLVQGPPGTGKTFLMAHLVRLLVEEGQRVLVTSLTHRAINNALSRIQKVAPEATVAKIGARCKAGEEHDVANHEFFGHSPLASLETGYVVGATPFALRSARMNQTTFDTIVFDEASQITLPLAIMAMLCGERYVFFGDHRQLPPVFSSLPQDPSLAGDGYRSVFDILTERGMESMLTTSHRLNDQLADWPSRTFYHDQLVPSAQARSRRVSYRFPPKRHQEVLAAEHCRVFVDVPESSASTRNPVEAKIVVEVIATLLESGIDSSEIGVVVPYRAQAREIKHQLLSLALPEAKRRAMVIDTVERLQGQEREVILISLATAKPSFARKISSFFFQPERWNVSLTRARSKLIIFGSRAVFAKEGASSSLGERIALCSSFLDSAYYFRWPDSRKNRPGQP